MNLMWYDWILVGAGVLVFALIIFATAYAVRARRFKVKGKNEKRKTANKK